MSYASVDWRTDACHDTGTDGRCACFDAGGAVNQGGTLRPDRMKQNKTKQAVKKQKQAVKNKLCLQNKRQYKTDTQCSYCSKVFKAGTYYSVVTEHGATCVRNPKRRRLCCSCGYVTPFYKSLKAHRQRNKCTPLTNDAAGKDAVGGKARVDPQEDGQKESAVSTWSSSSADSDGAEAAQAHEREDRREESAVSTWSSSSVESDGAGAACAVPSATAAQCANARHKIVSNVPLSTLGRNFDLILADPPWCYHGNKAQPGLNGLSRDQYSTMTWEELQRMRGSIHAVAKSPCVMFMWCSGPVIDKSIELMRFWGFDYKTIFINWVKVRRAEVVADLVLEGSGGDVNDALTPVLNTMPLGWWSLPCSEFLLVGVRGSGASLIERTSRPKQVLFAEKTQHSAKPVAVYGLVERMLRNPGSRQCLELFARDGGKESTQNALTSVQSRWTLWGNQA